MTALAVAAVEPERQTVIYARISMDGAGAGLGVKRQETECRQFADYLGRPVDNVYRDNNKSAKQGSHRPAFEDMLDDIRRGDVGMVIAWHFDRVTRNDDDFARFMEVCKAHHVQVRLKTSGDLDLSTPTGRQFARFQAAQAIYEIEHKAERMQSKHDELARDGKPSGGVRRFGYNHDMSLRADEVAIIKELADRILAGESLASLARDLDRRGVLTVSASTAAERKAAGLPPLERPPAKHWRPQTIRLMLSGEHLLGRRTHNGVVTKADAWPAALGTDTWLALRKQFKDPARNTNANGDNAVKMLLVRLARCAECGATMKSASNGPRKDNAWLRSKRYVCTGAGCTLSRAAAPVDGYVTAAVVALLERIDVTGLIAVGDDADTVVSLRAQVAEQQATIENLATALGEGDLSPLMAKASAAKAEARLDALTRQLSEAEADATDARRRPVRVLAGVTGPDAQAMWDTLPLERRRAIIDLLVDVRLTRADPAHNGVGPEAVVIERKALT